MEAKFTHLNDAGRARMVDVTEKNITQRTAVARGSVRTSRETIVLIKEQGLKKGDVLAVAQVAGIMAAKKTSDIIPMCHPLNLTGVDIDFRLVDEGIIEIEARVKVSGQTGVEMEALTAVSVAALTIYDMCKAVQKDIIIRDCRLVYKAGGKSGVFQAD